MALFRRKPNAARARAAALAARGVAGRATIVALHETGHARDAHTRELALTLDVELPDGTLRVAHTQFMGRFARHGLAAGEPVRVLYDSADPRLLTVTGHERLRTEVVGGEIVAAPFERQPAR